MHCQDSQFTICIGSHLWRFFELTAYRKGNSIFYHKYDADVDRPATQPGVKSHAARGRGKSKVEHAAQSRGGRQTSAAVRSGAAGKVEGPRRGGGGASPPAGAGGVRGSGAPRRRRRAGGGIRYFFQPWVLDFPNLYCV